MLEASEGGREEGKEGGREGGREGGEEGGRERGRLISVNYAGAHKIRADMLQIHTV